MQYMGNCKGENAKSTLVLSKAVRDLFASDWMQIMVLTRTSVSPFFCELPNDCGYKCTGQVTIYYSKSENQFKIVSSDPQNCSCEESFAVLGQFPITVPISTAKARISSFDVSACTMTVIAESNSLQCTGQYSGDNCSFVAQSDIKFTSSGR